MATSEKTEMKPNKGVQGTLHKVSGPLTPDVGSGNILATARTMDLPPLKNKGHEPRGNDFGERSQEQPMKKGSNKAFHHYGAQGAPKVNADVRSIKGKQYG